MSPLQKRNNIKPELDEIEEEFIEAFEIYRGTEVWQDFNKYKEYYEDAEQQQVE